MANPKSRQPIPIPDESESESGSFEPQESDAFDNTQESIDGRIPDDRVPIVVLPTPYYKDVLNNKQEVIGRKLALDDRTSCPVQISQREWAFLSFIRAFGNGTLEMVDIKNGAVEVIGSIRQRVDFSAQKTIETLFTAEPDKIVVRL